MAVAAVRTSKLTKDYGLGRGLFDLDLQVAQQEVFGYLGPNGAGKSTTVRCLMGLIRPTAGSAQVFGLDCIRDAVEVMRKVGYIPGEMPQFGSLRGREVVAYLGGMRGGADARVVRSIAERFNLDLNRRYREYSSGNKRKLGIVLAFMHKPQLLILDEPTSGLDPLNQQEFYNLLRETRDAGATVFLSSHILSEVERVCDRVGIIRSGRLVKVAELDEVHRIRLNRVEIEFSPDSEIPEAAIRATAGVEDVVVDGTTLICTLRGAFQPLLEALEGSQVTNLVSRHRRLYRAGVPEHDPPGGRLLPDCRPDAGRTLGVRLEHGVARIAIHRAPAAADAAGHHRRIRPVARLWLLCDPFCDLGPGLCQWRRPRR